MPTKLTALHPDRGLLRLVLRLPIWLYQARLGWLLGGRFLMLTHIGRKSGVPHQTVLEVVGHDSLTDTYIIASGWGAQADWFRNIQKTAHVLVDTGHRRFEAVAERMSEEDVARAVRDYAHRHSFAFRTLAGVMIGRRLSGTEEDYRELARSVPMVALRPRACVRDPKSSPG